MWHSYHTVSTLLFKNAQMVFSSAHKYMVNVVRFTALSMVTIKKKQKNVHLRSGRLLGGWLRSCLLTFHVLEFLPVPVIFGKSLITICKIGASLLATAMLLCPITKKRLGSQENCKIWKRAWRQWSLQGQRRLRPPDINNGTEAPQCFIKRHHFVRSACHICQSLLYWITQT